MLAALLLMDYQGEIVITAGSDGVHMAGSRHYVGEALDLRRWNISDVPAFIAKLSSALGPRFSVIDEHDHLHVQVRKGSRYP
jgi:hypothetical protein